MPRGRSAQLAILAGAFAAGTLIARAAGEGWGEASAFGQIAFAVVLVAVLLAPAPPGRREPSGVRPDRTG